MPIILVPTSHIAEESIRKIKEVIEKIKPDCVAVELDQNRYQALKTKQSSSLKSLGPSTWLIFTLLKKLQKKVGEIVNVIPGSDMLTAIEFSTEKNIPVYFIDQDIQITLFNFQNLKITEKLKLIRYALTASFSLYTGTGKTDQKIDLTKVPEEELIEKAMAEFQRIFPKFYKILVEDRNVYMANQIKEISKAHKTIVAVVGAGHRKGIKALLENK